MKFVFYSFIPTESLLQQSQNSLNYIAINAKGTLLHDMNGIILTHKISFVNYFATEI